MAQKERELYEKKLWSGGVTFHGEYLGSVPIEKPVKDMLREFTVQVIVECINIVAHRNNLIPEHPVNSIVEAVIGEPRIDKSPIEMNISAKMIKIIKMDSLFQRHPISFLSYAAQGEKGGTESVVGYIGKNTKGEDRRCHVIKVDDAARLMGVMSDAIKLAAQTVNMTQDGFIIPTAPARVGRSSVDTTPRPSTSNNNNSTGVPPIMLTELAVAADLGDQVYYHGTMVREQAVQLLKREGDFLVRKSDTMPGQYIMSGCYSDGFHTHILLLDDDKNVRTGNHTFDSISSLVRYYMETGKSVESLDGKTSLFLKSPIPRN